MMNNNQLNDNEKKYLQLILSFFDDYRHEIERQINAAKIEREVYTEHLFLYFSYDNFSVKSELPIVASICVKCKDGDVVDLILHRNLAGQVKELEVFSYLFYELDCSKICEGAIINKYLRYENGTERLWELNEGNNQLAL